LYITKAEMLYSTTIRRRGRNGKTRIRQRWAMFIRWRGDTTHTESPCELWLPLQTLERLGIVDPLPLAFFGFEPRLLERVDVEFKNVIFRT